jgi:hypothetical protein
MNLVVYPYRHAHIRISHQTCFQYRWIPYPRALTNLLLQTGGAAFYYKVLFVEMCGETKPIRFPSRRIL